jgi:hypothetical protein
MNTRAGQLEQRPDAAVEINPPWAPRVPRHEIARLYATDARGIVDEEMIDEVGYGLLARCEAILIATEAVHGRVRCPRCRQTFRRRRGPDEVLQCPDCGWQHTW